MHSIHFTSRERARLVIRSFRPQRSKAAATEIAPRVIFNIGLRFWFWLADASPRAKVSAGGKEMGKGEEKKIFRDERWRERGSRESASNREKNIVNSSNIQ
jgi:hypothetical protein